MLARSERWVQFVDSSQWFLWRAQEGRLTAESDRSIIANLIDSMLGRKLKHFESSLSDAPSQWFRAMQGALTSKTLPDMSEQSFAKEFGLEGLGGRTEQERVRSLPAVVCAALAGQPHLVTLCLEARCSVDMPVRRGAPGLCRGWTALFAVCYCRPQRQLEVMEVLLQARANVEHEANVRMLHLCTTPGAVDLLMQYRADLNSRSFPWGASALTDAVAINSNASTVAALIRHGAPLQPLPRGGCGCDPLLSACLFIDDTDIVNVLLAHRADVNARCQPEGAAKYLARALSVYHGSNLHQASPLVQIMANGEGLPVLGFAAFSGKASMVQALLDAHATLDQTNRRGITARALAEQRGFSHLFADVDMAAATSMVNSSSQQAGDSASAATLEEADEEWEGAVSRL